MLTAHFTRLSLPLLLCQRREMPTISGIFSNYLVYVPKRGYLTGVTESRLSEIDLLMQISHFQCVRYMLTGQIISVFKDR